MFRAGFQMDADLKRILFVLFLAAILGLGYVFLMPPWQHYDEPQHFEYAWWIAEKGRLPKPDDVDPEMRRNVALSMIQYHFYDGLGYQPDVNDTLNPLPIGPASQLINPPFYYILASLPMRLFPPQAVNSQLFAARLVSWLLYLFSILAAWGVTVEITPPRHGLRWFLPLILACIPGYLDIMTAVNSDVGAITLAFFCLWGCVRILRRGFSWLATSGVILSAVLIFWTKETAYFMIGIASVTLWLGVWPSTKRWIARLALVGAGLAALFIMLSWDDAAYWYRSTAQSTPTRAVLPQAVQGNAVFQIDNSAYSTPSWLPALVQPISRQPLVSDQDRYYTLAAWMWAGKPMQVSSPVFAAGKTFTQKQVSVSQEPVFVAFTAVLPAQEWGILRVILQPSQMGAQNGGKVYYDGVTVVEGGRPLDQAPVFTDKLGKTGTWGGLPFTNLLRNGSAEIAGPRLIPSLDALGARILPDKIRPSLFVTSLYDVSGAGFYYYGSAARLFRTFWGWFGWGHVPLLGHKPYRILLGVTLIGLALTLAWIAYRLLKRKGLVAWDVILIFALALLGSWGIVLIRGVGYVGADKLYLPVARYGFPALIPTVLVLVAGWSGSVVIWFEKHPAVRWIPPALAFCFVGGLQIWSILSIVTYYSK